MPELQNKQVPDKHIQKSTEGNPAASHPRPPITNTPARALDFCTVKRESKANKGGGSLLLSLWKGIPGLNGLELHMGSLQDTCRMEHRCGLM